MLEFIKKILSKVSFDLALFEKELKKSLKWLGPKEVNQLKGWCYYTFTSNRHSLVLDKCFV